MGDGRVGKEVWNNMERNVKVVPKTDYPDIVPIHPELSVEELDRLIEEETEKAKEYTEWPDI